MNVEVEFHNGIKMLIPETTIEKHSNVLSLISKDIGLGEKYGLKLTPQTYIDSPLGINMEVIDIQNMIVVGIELKEANNNGR